MAKSEETDDLDSSSGKKGMSSQTKLLVGLFSAFFILMITTVVVVVLMLRPVTAPVEVKSAKASAQKKDTADAAEPAEKKSDESAKEDAKPEGAAAEGGEKAESKEGATDAAQGSAVYYTVKPPFIINFQYKGRMRFLQVSVDIMAHSDKVLNIIDKNLPLIKNNLIALFSSQDFDTLQTNDGREALRAQALKVVQKILEDQSGDTGADQVLFTSFVMQ